MSVAGRRRRRLAGAAITAAVTLAGAAMAFGTDALAARGPIVLPDPCTVLSEATAEALMGGPANQRVFTGEVTTGRWYPASSLGICTMSPTRREEHPARHGQLSMATFPGGRLRLGDTPEQAARRHYQSWVERPWEEHPPPCQPLAGLTACVIRTWDGWDLHLTRANAWAHVSMHGHGPGSPTATGVAHEVSRFLAGLEER